MNRSQLQAWWLDSWASLGYERSRAASPWQAVLAWGRACAQRRARFMRLSSADSRLLCAAEVACVPLGLRYAVEDAGQTAPWHLPERFLRISPEQLPEHPVVDPVALAHWVQDRGANAAQALLALCRQANAQARWHGLPLQGLAPALPCDARVAVCLHLFYPELWPTLQAHLRHIPQPWDLYISVPAFSITPAWAAIAQAHPRLRFMPLPNRGRDVAPWLTWLRSGALDGYDAVCKLHGKLSPHMKGGEAWRDELLQTLLGSAANVEAILSRFQAKRNLGLLGPASSQRLLTQAAGWNKNRQQVRRLAQQLRAPLNGAGQRFFAGTMFWFRPDAMSILRASTLDLSDFPLEMGQTEGTLAHALERLVSATVQAGGYDVEAWPDATQADAA